MFTVITSAFDIEVPLHETTQPILGTRHIAVPVCYDTVDGGYVVYTANKGLFDIKSKLKNRDIIYTISVKSDSIGKFSFCKDSVLNWNINDDYDSHSVKFTYDNQSYFFIPGTKIQYNDSIYNQFPCMISDGDIKHGCFNTDDPNIFILRDNILPKTSLFVKENGSIHNDAFFNGLNYKKEYSLKDTIPINNIPFIIKKLDWDSSKLFLTPTNCRVNRKIDSDWITHLFEDIDNKEYVFIDFWGTWCAPCIQSLPKIKELYLANKNRIEFISICYDTPANYTKYKEILDNYGIEWKNDFISSNSKSSIVEYLGIESYPSFVLINKYGEIIFILSGENSLDVIDTMLGKL